MSSLCNLRHDSLINPAPPLSGRVQSSPTPTPSSTAGSTTPRSSTRCARRSWRARRTTSSAPCPTAFTGRPAAASPAPSSTPRKVTSFSHLFFFFGWAHIHRYSIYLFIVKKMILYISFWNTPILPSGVMLVGRALRVDQVREKEWCNRHTTPSKQSLFGWRLCSCSTVTNTFSNFLPYSEVRHTWECPPRCMMG